MPRLGVSMIIRISILSFVLILLGTAAPFTQDTRGQSGEQSSAQAVAGILEAVVRVRAEIPESARTAPFLGTEREGNGVVIDREGHVITIGYIVLESRKIEIETSSGIKMPAFLVAYDANSGYGLLRTAVPLKIDPIAFGDSNKLGVQQPVAIVGFGPANRIAPAVVAARRTFVGYWEYMLEKAIFTVPPTSDYAGAALVNKDFKLVGIGSLFVRDSLGNGANLPGNMFLPINALKSVLPNLKRLGRSELPAKPWIGVFLTEQFGRVMITNVSTDGPAHRAGLETGDIILGINDAKIAEMGIFYKSLWSAGTAGVKVQLKILHGSDIRHVGVKSMDRYRHYRTDAMN